MNPGVALACLCLLCASLAGAAGPAGRFVQTLALPEKRVVLVAEGDLEARSIGSYSLRIYSTDGARSDVDTTFFLAGIIRAREGSVEKVFLADLGNRGAPSLVVTIRSAGTGGYLAADAFDIVRNDIVLRAQVAGLPANADPVVALDAVLRRAKRK